MRQSDIQLSDFDELSRVAVSGQQSCRWSVLSLELEHESPQHITRPNRAVSPGVTILQFHAYRLGKKTYRLLTDCCHYKHIVHFAPSQFVQQSLLPPVWKKNIRRSLNLLVYQPTYSFSTPPNSLSSSSILGRLGLRSSGRN
jgi:hypothetical protein